MFTSTTCRRCCEECVATHASGSPLVFKCPECRCDTPLKGSAAEGAAALPTNYAINGVVEALAQEERLKKAVRCQGGCVDEPPADWKCEECGVVLCNECCIMHSRLKTTAAHQTCNIAKPSIKGPPKAQIASGGGGAAATAKLHLCAHHGEPLKVYCGTHKKPICLLVGHPPPFHLH